MAEEIGKVIEKFAAGVTPRTVKHAGSVVKIGGSISRIRFLRAPRFKKPFTLFYPMPWDRLRDHKAALSAAQKGVNAAFSKVSAATAGWKLSYRLAVIGKALENKSFGGMAKKPAGKIPSEDEIRRVLTMV